MLCHKRLIRCGNALPCLETTLYEGVSRLDASHHFYHDPNLVIFDDRLKIMYDLILYRISGEIPQIQHVLNIQLIADPLVDPRAVGIHNLNDPRTNCSISHNCYIYHFCPSSASCAFPTVFFRYAFMNRSMLPSNTAVTLLFSTFVL